MPSAIGSGNVTAPAAGAPVASIAAGSLPAGRYRVHVEAGVSGNAAADLGNMKLQVGGSFGLKGLRVDSALSLAALQTELDKIKNVMNADLVRFRFAWGLVETADGVFDWTKIDNAVNESLARGLKIALHMAGGTPAWLGLGGFDPPVHNQDQLDRWKSVCQKVSGRYGLGIDLYEIWNEPNLASFWASGSAQSAWPAEYAKLLRHGALGLRAGNPAVKVAGINTSRPGALGYLAKVYDALEADVGVNVCQANGYFFDILSVHPYCLTHPPDFVGVDDTADSWGTLGRVFTDYRRMRDYARSREGGFAKPLFSGEFGYATDASTTNGPVADATRATYVPKAYDIIRADGFHYALAWYSYDDASSAPFDIAGTATGTAFAAVPRLGSADLVNPLPQGASGNEEESDVETRLDGTQSLSVAAIAAGTAGIEYQATIIADRLGA